MHDRSAIRSAHEAGASIRPLARELGVDRNTVRRAIAPDARAKYWRRSATEDATEAVRDVLADYPHMAVNDVATLIDWRHSRRALSNLVARLRPEYVRRSSIETRPTTALAAGRVLPAGRISAGTMTTGTLTIGRLT